MLHALAINLMDGDPQVICKILRRPSKIDEYAERIKILNNLMPALINAIYEQHKLYFDDVIL